MHINFTNIHAVDHSLINAGKFYWIKHANGSCEIVYSSSMPNRSFDLQKKYKKITRVEQGRADAFTDMTYNIDNSQLKEIPTDPQQLLQEFQNQIFEPTIENINNIKSWFDGMQSAYLDRNCKYKPNTNVKVSITFNDETHIIVYSIQGYLFNNGKFVGILYPNQDTSNLPSDMVAQIDALSLDLEQINELEQAE